MSFFNYKIRKYSKVLILGLIGVFSCFLLPSCSKKGSVTPHDNNKGNGLSGSIYFKWANEGVLKMDLTPGTKSTVLLQNSSLNSWDISRDQKLILEVSDAPTTVQHYYNADVYTVSGLDNNKKKAKFIDYHYSGMAGKAYLSPDQKKIAVAPANHVGIIIFNLKGEVIGQIPVKERSDIAWMPDGSLLFTLKDGIIRTNKDFTGLSIVKEFDFNTWGDIAVSPDGKRIALYGGNHIWMMDSSGQHLTQVTTGEGVERHPVFSPDGKNLLIGTDFHQTGPFGYLWYLAVIPADGKKYNVDKGKDEQVLFIKDPKKDRPQAASGYMVWR